MSAEARTAALVKILQDQDIQGATINDFIFGKIDDKKLSHTSYAGKARTPLAILGGKKKEIKIPGSTTVVIGHETSLINVKRNWAFQIVHKLIKTQCGDNRDTRANFNSNRIVVVDGTIAFRQDPDDLRRTFFSANSQI